ncbi:MAG: sporulation protein YunB [Bacilli bacterium]|nr:sporulation protein YunB [Bacilli bacterium]
MKRMKTKRKQKRINFIPTIIVLLFIFLIYTFNQINKVISPLLLEYAEIETKKFSSIIINQSVTKDMLEQLNDIYVIDKDLDGKIITIDLDPVLVNRFILDVVAKIQYNLKQIENGTVENLRLNNNLTDYKNKNFKEGIIFEIPMKAVFNNSLLANLGPKVPVRINLTGDVLSNVETKVTNYGINNALLETFLKLKVSEKMVLPVSSKVIEVETTIPLSVKIIQGNIPDFYYGGFGTKTIPFNQNN